MTIYGYLSKSAGAAGPRRGRSGFTLVELLTVIAIIGILAGIVLPVVGKVRTSARSAACQSNLRQVGVAVLLYTNDQRGRTLPGPLYGQVAATVQQGNKKGRLAGFLIDYAGVPTQQKGQESVVPLLACPGVANEDPGLIEDAQGIIYALNTSKLISGYDGSMFGNPDSSYNKPVALPLVPDPGRNWMLSDMDNELAASAGYGWTAAKMIEKAAHGATRNRLYFDGHVAAVAK